MFQAAKIEKMLNNNTLQFVIKVTGNVKQVMNAIQQNAVSASKKVIDLSATMGYIRDFRLAFGATKARSPAGSSPTWSPTTR